MNNRYFPILLLLLINLKLTAQPGALDYSFNPTDKGSSVGADNRVSAIELQPDGKILIGGAFDSYNDIPCGHLARLNADGSLDTSFMQGTGANEEVSAFAIQPDGKILIGGNFTNYNGTPCGRIARLNADGSIDATFIVGNGTNKYVSVIVIQPDGKILIGGDFGNYNGTPCGHIARLNVDGSLDGSFNQGTGANNLVLAIALQPDGKILIGGTFTSYDGSPSRRIARLNANGSLETSFIHGNGANEWIEAIAVQPDGKVLIGGLFTIYDGTARNRLARLNADGSLDTSFDVGPASDSRVSDIALQPDGKILVGGAFDLINFIYGSYLKKFNTDGSTDTSFDPGLDANEQVDVLALRSDGKIFVGGSFTSYNGVNRGRIALINSEGSLNSSFNPVMGANFFVRAFALQPNGKILVGGLFTIYNDTRCRRIAQLNADGSIDDSFYAGEGPNGVVRSLALRSNGKIIVGGGFNSFDSISHGNIVQLNTDGSIDTLFNTRTGADNWVAALAVQPDGKTLIGGNFTSYNSVARGRIARLNADGSLDSSFDPGNGTNDLILALSLQPDGKILIGGQFTEYAGTPRAGIARLNSDGSLDLSFNPGTGIDGSISALSLFSNGKILVGGNFLFYDGNPSANIARLNIDGSLDDTFNLGSGIEGTVSALSLQPDGKILVGGNFTSYNNIPRSCIARLHEDGSFDTSFNSGSGANGAVLSLSLQADGKVLLGGIFTDYNGIAKNRVARIHGDGTSGVLSQSDWDSALRVYPNPSTDQVWLDLSDFAGESVMVFMYNSSGKQVLQRRMAADTAMELNLRAAGLNSGAYTVRVHTARRVVSGQVVFVK
jgi:uncharacterized delta-60 repeat protein